MPKAAGGLRRRTVSHREVRRGQGPQMTNRVILGRNTSRVIVVGAFLASIAWMLACAPAPVPRPPLPPPTYSFSYEPPQQGARRTGITLALVRPSYEPVAPQASAQAWRQWQVVGQYLQSMGGDFQRMLVARGFTLTGPFDDLNQMTYPDKQTANLTLTPRVFLNVDRRVESTGENEPLAFSGTAVGTLTANAWITFELIEPLSGEKMWIKKLTLSPKQERYTYDYQVSRESQGGRTIRRVSYSRSNDQHVLAKVLEEYYAIVMQTAWDYFNPDEIAALKKMADEVRQKKRF